MSRTIVGSEVDRRARLGGLPYAFSPRQPPRPRRAPPVALVAAFMFMAGAFLALWCAWQPDADADPPRALYFRAHDRDAAKATIWAGWPDARFYR